MKTLWRLTETFDLCHCQQRIYNKVLRWNFVIDQILIFHHNLQINSLKILQCDFSGFLFSYFVSHSWGIPMMKITGLSHLFKWENLHNWWLTKYFFAPLYEAVQLFSTFIIMIHFSWAPNQNIRLDYSISEGSCDNEDWGHDYWKFSFAITGINYTLKCITIENSYLNCNNISKHNCFVYFFSNKSSFGEHKGLLSKIFKTLKSTLAITY